MKVMIRKGADGILSVYIPKKDLEEPIVSMELPTMWGGLVTMANGWQLALPEMPEGTKLPITVEAKRTTTGEEV